MTTLRQAIWQGRDPYANTPKCKTDYQAFRKRQDVLYDALSGCGRVAEIGVWKGYTSIEMAKRFDGEILAVDHFRGSSEHFLGEKWREDLPGLYDTFRRNVIEAGLSDRITPLPLDSQAAFETCIALGLKFDLVHIDGAHDYESVKKDLKLWSLLSPVIVMDDFTDAWPGVMSAYREFVEETGWGLMKMWGGKGLLKAPKSALRAA